MRFLGSRSERYWRMASSSEKRRYYWQPADCLAEESLVVAADRCTQFSVDLIHHKVNKGPMMSFNCKRSPH